MLYTLVCSVRLGLGTARKVADTGGSAPTRSAAGSHAGGCSSWRGIGVKGRADRREGRPAGLPVTVRASARDVVWCRGLSVK